MMPNQPKPVRGLTAKQKTVLKKLSQREYAVAAPTLNCSEGLLFRLADQGLVRTAVGTVGNHGKRGWEITRNGLVLLNIIEPGSVQIPDVPDASGGVTRS